MGEGRRIHAVLLVPAEGDPHRLLRTGPCGARPPMVHRWLESARSNRLWSRWYVWSDRSARIHDSQRALVLAWDGEPAAAGIFHARYKADDIDAAELVSLLYGLGSLEDMAAEVRHWKLNDALLGTVVLLDADGQEVTP